MSGLPQPSDGSRPRTLAFAYTCHPDSGSEPGAAWATVETMLERTDVTVLTTPDSVAEMRRHGQPADGGRLRAVAVPVPRGMHRLLRARWLSRSLWFIVYLAWLRAARKVAVELQREHQFDVAMHVAFGSYWLPSPAVELGLPSIWGPVGGATTTPPRLWRYLGAKGVFDEISKLVSMRVMSALPQTRRTYRTATVRVVETVETLRALPADLQADTLVANRAILVDAPPLQARDRQPFLLFPSSLLGRKGARLVLRALSRAPEDVEVRFVNTGPDEDRLRALARRLNVADRAHFLGRIPRDELFEMEAEAAAIVFAGLREEGGCALVEAMKMGVPVIVVGHGGARLIAESGSDPTRVHMVDADSPVRTERELAQAMTGASRTPATGTGPYLDHAATVETLHSALERALGSNTALPRTGVAGRSA